MNSNQIDFSHRSTIFQRVPKHKKPVQNDQWNQRPNVYVIGIVCLAGERNKNFDPSSVCSVRRTLYISLSLKTNIVLKLRQTDREGGNQSCGGNEIS